MLHLMNCTTLLLGKFSVQICSDLERQKKKERKTSKGERIACDANCNNTFHLTAENID